MKVIKNIALALALLLTLSGVACSKESDSAAYTDTQEVTNYVKISMKGGGDIVIKLEPEQAPISVKNFQDLVGKGFYDGVIFHRIVPGFVLQGGDPEGTGTGGPGYTIKGEFQANGVNNTISHKRGVVSMARTNAGYDTAGSQFFICVADALSLDTQYAAFGEVVEGMDIVDTIVSDYEEGNLTEYPQMAKVSFVNPA